MSDHCSTPSIDLGMGSSGEKEIDPNTSQVAQQQEQFPPLVHVPQAVLEKLHPIALEILHTQDQFVRSNPLYRYITRHIAGIDVSILCFAREFLKTVAEEDRKMPLDGCGAGKQYFHEIDVDALIRRDPLLRNTIENAVSVINSISFPAFVMIQRGRLYRYNSALVELSPFTREELDSDTFDFLELFAEESLVNFMQTILRIRSNRKLVNVTMKLALRKKNGEKVPYLAGMSLLREPHAAHICGSLIILMPIPM